MLRLVFFCVWAALTAGLCYAAVTVKAPQIQEDIRSRTAAMIAPQDAKVDVVVDGRFVTLRGLAANEAAKSQHLATADDVYGALGPTDALWLAAAQKASHYLSAEKGADGSVVLSGVVPTAAVRDDIAAAAASVFKDAVTNRITVSDAADGEALPPATDGLGALSALDKGLLLVAPSGVTLSGATGSAQVAAASSGLEGKDGAPWRVFVAGPGQAASAILTAAKTPDGKIEARGAVSSDAAKASIIQALSAGGLKVVDLLTVQSAGLPENWDKRALAGASAITKLDWGIMSIDPEKSSLRGAGPQGEMGAIKGDIGDGWTKDLLVRAETAEPDMQAEMDKLRASRDDLKAQLAMLKDEAASKAVVEVAAAPASPEKARCESAISKLLEGGAVRFDPNSAEISKNAYGLIKKLAGAAKPCVQSSTMALVISGHTDNQGSPKSNLDLSKRRAETVRKAFAALGLNGDAMSARGFGESAPVSDNETDEGRQANRRIGFDWISR
jgi:outer membrane protein OmpA-like peptidoglycan-associated protein/osmotically-inducible protein OsmY